MTSKNCVVTAAMSLILLVCLVSCAPLSEMKHITLHVKSEVLENHKIVITLEPLDNVTKEHGEDFQDEFNVTVQIPNGDDGGQTSNVGKSSESEGDVELSGSTTPKTTLSTPEVTTNSSSSSSGTNDTSTTPPNKTMTRIATPSEPGVSHFLVTVPPIKCPAGYRPDPSGKCREVLNFFSLSAGKSMSSSNIVNSSSGMKNYEKKITKKFIMG